MHQNESSEQRLLHRWVLVLGNPLLKPEGSVKKPNQVAQAAVKIRALKKDTIE
jgi:hypothetical protein